MPVVRPSRVRWLGASIVATALAACGGDAEPPPSAAVLGVTETLASATPPITASTPPSTNPTPAAPPSAPQPKSIVETAASLPQFSSLVAAVRFASVDDDLVRLLSGNGAFTVFAPTNDAFDALARELTRLPSATAADLLVPGNQALVRAILEYHVLDTAVPKSAVPLGAPIDPVLAGTGTFRIDAAGPALVITDARARTARIVATDVAAANGLIHVIDRVILPPGPDDRTVVEVAQGNQNLSSLVAALQFASNDGDLLTLLGGQGPFTVLAPTDAAFDALARELTGDPQATAAALLTPANRPLLRAVLTYHVIAAKVLAGDLKPGRAIEPALGQGSFFKAEIGATGPEIVDGRGRRAAIVRTDIVGANGVVHLLDRVILPAQQSIAQIAAAAPQFSTLVSALAFASIDGDLLRILDGPGPFTVFAPTNAAFDALARELTHDPKATAAALLVPANREQVRAVLLYHVLDARVLAAEVPLGRPIDPVLPGPASFVITPQGGGLGITDARHRRASITATDVFATNGVIHVIDRVILPPLH
jgi:transforming growth factor-beta-induced protein